MVLRRAILGLMLAVLALCALAGVAAAFLANTREVVGIVVAAATAAVTLGLMLPLTLLVERPKYRAGGFAAMATLGTVAVCIGGIMVVEMMRLWSSRLDNAFASGIGFSLLYGIPATGGLLLVQFKWARTAAWVLAGAGVVGFCIAALGMLMLLVEAWNIADRFYAGSGLFYLSSFLTAMLLVNIGQEDRRLFRYPAIATAWFAFLIFLLLLVEIPPLPRYIESEIAKAGAIIYGLPVFFAHVNLLLMARVNEIGRWLRTLTIAGSGVTVTLIAVAIAMENEAAAGMGAASGIVTACGSLAVIVVALLYRRFNPNTDVMADGTQLTDIEIACPRCKKRQTLPLGDVACGGCGLKLVLKAIEPRCFQCGYLLYGTTSNRCPECGAVQGGESGSPQPDAGRPLRWRSRERRHLRILRDTKVLQLERKRNLFQL